MSIGAAELPAPPDSRGGWRYLVISCHADRLQWLVARAFADGLRGFLNAWGFL